MCNSNSKTAASVINKASTGSLTVVAQKGMASFQDLGRAHAQHLGFSASGAADEYSFLLANKLIGNAANTPALELTFGQISLRANNTCTLVLTGADCLAHISPDKAIENTNELEHTAIASQKTLKLNQPFQLQAGEQLTLHSPKAQVHSYLAIAGGFIADTFAQSVSFSRNEKALGVFQDEIKPDGLLLFHPLANEQTSETVVSTSTLTNTQVAVFSWLTPVNFHQSGPLVLRFMPNQFWHHLSELQQQCFIEQPYQVHANSNRMGYRLLPEAPLPELFTAKQKSQYQRLSKAVTFGTIQLPENGEPIVLMKDRQTIGGYPVLGSVLQTDLFRLSQKRPGERVCFLPISIELAQQQLSAFYQKFK